jgi:hypothetical protein
MITAFALERKFIAATAVSAEGLTPEKDLRSK